MLDQHIRYEKSTMAGWLPTDAKLEWAKIIIGGHLNSFRTVNSVLTAPAICPSSGRIVQRAGHDPELSVLIVGSDDYVKIPEFPTLDDVKVALAAIWLPISQFPYGSPTDQSVIFTAALTAVARKLLPTAPAFGFDAPVQGSGKTLLLKFLCVLSGNEPTISPAPDSGNDEEVRKRLFALLREGQDILVFDNIVGVFDSPSLAALLTSETYSDRVLGESRTDTVPNTPLVVISGNNLTLQGDLPRRVLTCRIDPKEELPHQRKFDFDPVEFATEYRQELVAAAITIMRAFYCEKFETRIGPGRMASFEVWDDLVRQTVCWLAKMQGDDLIPRGRQPDEECYPELVDPMVAINDAVVSDPYRERHGLLLIEIAKAMGFGVNGIVPITFTTKALIKASNPLGNTGVNGFALEDDEDSVLFDVLTDVGGDAVGRRINQRSLGKYLGRNKDRIVGGLCLRQGAARQHAATWWVEAMNGEFGGFSEFVSTCAGKDKNSLSKPNKLTKLTKLTASPSSVTKKAM